MNNAFDDREKGFETQFKLSQETEFRVAARRNKILGEWLGEKLGLSPSEIPDFASAIVVSDLEEPGDSDVIRACMTNIQKRNANITEEDIRQKIEEFSKLAFQQITGN